MKIFLLAACLLIITKVKAIDLEKLQAFKGYLQECEQDNSIPKIPGVSSIIRPDLLFCAFKKEGIIDEYNYFDIKGIVNACDIHTFDPLECQRLSFMCYQQVAGSSSNLSVIQSIKSSNKEFVIKLLECEIINGLIKLIPV